MLALGLLLSSAIGVALGLLGGGGSILTVPTLHYAFGLEAHAAIATSLAVVAITGFAALIPHARAGRVQWRIGAWFGGASMAGAYGAARIARHLPGTLLLVGFGIVMLVTATAMLGRRRAPAPRPTARIPVVAVAVQGLAIGAIAGLLGAGGGFLIVPALVVLTGLAMPQAVATSLLVIVVNSIAGFAGAIGSVPIHGALIGLVAGTAVVGSVAGAWLAGRIRADRLRALFGWFVVAMAVFVLGQEVPRALGHAVDPGPRHPVANHHGGGPDAVSPAV
jgi:uncharacterized membrane protein YfcA